MARGRFGAKKAQAMAKKAGFGRTTVLDELADPQPPEGAQMVDLPGPGGFLNFEREGQEIVGTLIGVTEVENKQSKQMVARFVFLPDGDSDTKILPDHYDLVQRLNKLQTEAVLPITGVWIAYRGKQKAPGVISGFLHRYKVARVPGGQQQALGGDVPF